jgi:hypothetical protein
MSLWHASSNVAAMRAGDDEETSMKLVYLYEYSREYYANNKKKDAAS